MTSKQAPITTTGIKGFLLWFKREQPSLYNKIAPTLPATIPKAFSSYNATNRHLRKIYKDSYVKRQGRTMGALSDYSSYTLPTLYVTSASTADPVAVNYTSQLAPPSYIANPATLTTDVSTGDLQTVSVDSSPVASAANTGTTSNAIATAIGQTVGAAAKVYLTNQQAQLQQSVVSAQLARAAAGLPPLNTSLNQLGVPTVSVSGSLTSSPLLLLGIAAAIALALSSGGSSKRSAVSGDL